MYNDEFEDTFGFSGEDAGLSQDEIDDMLWCEEMKSEKQYDKSQKDKKQQSQGCYIATCVYGSYDCTEVWTLRRFRDYTLSKNIFGRAFIKVYYKLSPKIVKVFGKEKWFKNIWKKALDKFVIKLKNRGVESGPYKDKNW